MKALTIWQPWAWCIAHSTKRVENRSWAPPKDMFGQRFAIHAASKGYCPRELEDERFIKTAFGLEVPKSLPRGSIVAVATLKETIDYTTRGAHRNPWFFGPVGWVLSDVVALETPVVCKGNQGLWEVPPDVCVLVQRQVGKLPNCPTCSTVLPRENFKGITYGGYSEATCNNCNEPILCAVHMQSFELVVVKQTVGRMGHV